MKKIKNAAKKILLIVKIIKIFNVTFVDLILNIVIYSKLESVPPTASPLVPLPARNTG